MRPCIPRVQLGGPPVRRHRLLDEARLVERPGQAQVHLCIPRVQLGGPPVRRHRLLGAACPEELAGEPPVRGPSPQLALNAAGHGAVALWRPVRSAYKVCPVRDADCGAVLLDRLLVAAEDGKRVCEPSAAGRVVRILLDRPAVPPCGAFVLPHHGQCKAAARTRRQLLRVEAERVLVALYGQDVPFTVPCHAQGMPPCDAGRHVVWIRPYRFLVHEKGLFGAPRPHHQVAHLEVRQGVAGIDLLRLFVACLRLALAAQPCMRVPRAGVHPCAQLSGYVEAAAHAEHPLVRPARIGVPSDKRHGAALDEQERGHVPRAPGKDGAYDVPDYGVRPGLVEPYDAHGVREGMPCPEQPSEPPSMRPEEPAQDGYAAPLGHFHDRLGALKGAGRRLDPGLCQGDRPAEAPD